MSQRDAINFATVFLFLLCFDTEWHYSTGLSGDFSLQVDRTPS